jgi:acetyl esterase/lipase
MFRMAVALLALLVCADTGQASPWPPSPDHTQFPLWSGAPPHPLAATLYDKETLERGEKLIAGKPFLYVHSVTKPTLTIYRPRGRSTAAGVLVFPGGGFWDLAIDLEGTEVCGWLTANGITCILVKYRVPGFDEKDSSRSGPYPKSPVALEDAQRAIVLTRYHARAWGLNPDKIGVIGFSAGGQLVAATSTHDRIYARTDAADDLSARPNFGIALYPGHLPTSEDKLELNPNIPVDARTPPQLIIQSGDDPVDSPNNALAYYVALHRAKVPAELHLYPDGGHAFGLRRTDRAITEWPSVALR